ncbi:MAG: aldehyde dehydrogenase family protein, partial [Myxococcota bacterium]
MSKQSTPIAQDSGAKDPGAKNPGAKKPGAKDPGAKDPGAKDKALNGKAKKNKKNGKANGSEVSRVAQIFESMEYGPAPESDAVAQAWLDGHHRKFGLFVDGEWRKPKSGRWFGVENPANTKELAQLAAADESDVDRAVKAAQAAAGPWEALGGHGRARFLYAIARHVQK